MKESLSHRYTSTYDTKLPSFKDSEYYVLRYFDDNNHPFKEWYLIIEGNDTVGQIFLKEHNEIGFTIFKNHQGNGYTEQAVKLLMKLHPRERYFLFIHNKNLISLHLADKMGFKYKGIIFEYND